MSHRSQRTVFKPSSITLGLLLALGDSSFAPYSVAAVPAAAVQHKQRYDLPAGPLLATLATISQQSGLILRLREQDLSGYHSAAIKGELTARQALDEALAGTSLQVAGNPDGSLSIVSRHFDPSTTHLTPLIVEGTRPAPSSSGPLRTQTALQQTPQSVKTIDNEVLTERQATSVEDALRNAAGVVAQKGNRGNAVYWVRGYEVTQTATDGLTTPETRNGLLLPATPIDGVEGLEVIKGPAAVMAGSSSPGGTINIIRKAPVTDPLHVLRGEATDRGEFKTALDLGGAITDDKAWRYRLNVARSRSSETYPDYDGSRFDYLAPVIDWRGDSTYVKVGAEFSDSRSAAGLAGTYYDTQAGKIRRLSNYRMGGKDDHISGVVKTGYYELKQDLSDDWSFNSKATHSDTELDFRINETYAVQANGDLINHQFSALSPVRYWSAQNDLRGTFDTGPVTHAVLLGIDYLHSNNSQYEYRGGRIITTGNINDRSTLDYPSIPQATDKSYDSRNIQQGVIVQNQMTILDRLHLVVAGKEAVWKSETRLVGRASSSYRQRKWVPNYGIAYDLTPAITLYANRLNGFSGNRQIDRVGNQLPPSTSAAKEVGLKFSLLGNRLSITTAVFDIEQTNVPVQDRSGQFLGSQGRNSKGFDLDINGEPLPGWNINASYAYSKFKDPDEINGQPNKITGQPRHSANLWSTYELQEGALKGLGAGIGITTASRTLSGYRTSLYYDVPGYVQTDLSLFYRRQDWSLNLGVKNAFDKEIYSYSSASAWMGVKEGRTTRLTAEYRF